MIKFYDELFILLIKIRPVIWVIPFSIGHSLFTPTVELLLAFFLFFYFLSLMCLILTSIMGSWWIKDFILVLVLDSKLFRNRLLIIEIKIAFISPKWGHAKFTTAIALDRTRCRLAKMLRKYLFKALGVIIVFKFLDARGHFMHKRQTMAQKSEKRNCIYNLHCCWLFFCLAYNAIPLLQSEANRRLI